MMGMQPAAMASYIRLEVGVSPSGTGQKREEEMPAGIFGGGFEGVFLGC